MGIELDLKRFVDWADTAIRNFQAKGMDLRMFVLPDVQQDPILKRTVVNPLPRPDELQLDKHPKTGKVVCYLRGRQVMFTSKLTNGCLFRVQTIEEKANV